MSDNSHDLSLHVCKVNIKKDGLPCSFSSYLSLSLSIAVSFSSYRPGYLLIFLRC